MAKYVGKGLVVEAFKWTGDIHQEADPLWLVEAIENGDVWFNNDGTPDVFLEVGQSRSYIAYRGDYVLQGKEGKIYTLTSEMFENLFELGE